MASYDKYSGASHFADDSNYEVQRSNHFELVIDLQNLYEPIDNLQEAIRLCCTSANIPNININPQDLKHGNETVHVAGAPTWTNLSISVYDTIGRDMADMLQQWFWRVFNPATHTMGLVSHYKCSGTLYLYSPDASTFRKWICYGLFPTSLNFGNYSSDGGGSPVTVQMELAVDRTEMVPFGKEALNLQTR